VPLAVRSIDVVSTSVIFVMLPADSVIVEVSEASH